jgi:hypothetical protein
LGVDLHSPSACHGDRARGEDQYESTPDDQRKHGA